MGRKRRTPEQEAQRAAELSQLRIADLITRCNQRTRLRTALFLHDLLAAGPVVMRHRRGGGPTR